MINAAQLVEIVGKDWVITQREQYEGYLTDQTCDAVKPKPADNIILVKPANSGEIGRVLKLANKEKTPVFVRGGGTGLCGGAVPTKDGIVLSTERLNKIEEVDRENLMITVQAGVTLEDMFKAVTEAGLFFPPHPGDQGAHAGGIVACNAGGTRAVKYGVVRNYVKGLEVVLPTGEILKLGGKLLKNNQGLDLLHLMVHSEGMLGVITKVIFRLYPQAAASATLLISFDDRHQAINTVPEILRSGVIPLAVEYMERDVVEISARYLGATWPATKGSAFLVIILNGVTEDEIYSQAEKVTEICEQRGAVDTLIAESKEEQEEILHIRSELYSAMKSHMGDTLDVVVPPASVGILTNMVDAIAKKYKTVIPIYGHVADGNFHPHPMIDLEERGILHEVKREIYKAAIELGGVVTGEHGVGQIRNVDLDLYPAGKSWQLMRGIKKVFDPNGILNPGVGLP